MKRTYPDPPEVKYPVRPKASSGTTGSERLLAQLARTTFLSLWSYPNITRAESHQNGSRQGKEIADLLMVFGNDIVVFSDKDCAFGETGNLAVDWARWYKKAVEKSARQLWGAERQIRTSPENMFLDRSCQVPFPIELPPADEMRIHLIVVANGASHRCAEKCGGSGTLIIAPEIVGDAHTIGDRPFGIGRVSTSRPFVHVFDDKSLRLLLQYLDTVSDFVGMSR